MKSFVMLFALCVVFTAQSQILKKTYHDYQKTKVHYVYYVNGSGQYNGLLTQYTYDGAKLGEETYVNGIKNGAYKEYYTRGAASKLKISGNYKNDEKNGKWITYTYVKHGQSYYIILQSMMFNDKEVDIFNTGVQTKVNEETYNNGQLTKEIIYHINGKIAISRNFINRTITGDYLAYNSINNLIIKGKIGDKGKMIGEWIIPRKADGTSSDKNNTEECVYTQKIKFDENGNIDTSIRSKSYYLSGKLRDSVRLISLEFPSGYNYSGFWFLCGKNTLIAGPYYSYYETGKIQSEGQYKIVNSLSVKTGIWKNYDTNGNLINEVNEDETREKLVKEKRDIAELQILIMKADSIILNEKNLGKNFQNLVQKKYSIAPPLAKYTVENTGSGYLYVVNKKPDLTFHFYEIHESFEDQVKKLKSKDNEIIRKVEDNKSYNKYRSNNDKIALDFDELSTRKNIYSEIVELGIKHTKLNGKLVQLADIKTKDLENQLKLVSSIEEKIKIIENYQLDPK